MNTRITLLLTVSAEDAVKRIRALPEIVNKTYVVTRRGRGIRIWRRRDEPPFELYEFTRVELRVALWPQRRGTKIVARTVQRPRMKGIAIAMVSALTTAGGNLIDDLVHTRDSRARWRSEKTELLNLVSRALMPVSISPDESGPYRE